MNAEQTHAHAWRLPAFVLFYILLNYLADAWGQALANKIMADWLNMLWVRYYFMWFNPSMWLAIPAWLLCHAGLVYSGLRYYRSGLPRWGWRLVIFGLLCTPAMGYCVVMLSLMLENMVNYLR